MMIIGFLQSFVRTSVVISSDSSSLDEAGPPFIEVVITSIGFICLTFVLYLLVCYRDKKIRKQRELRRAKKMERVRIRIRQRREKMRIQREQQRRKKTVINDLVSFEF